MNFVNSGVMAALTGKPAGGLSGLSGLFDFINDDPYDFYYTNNYGFDEQGSEVLDAIYQVGEYDDDIFDSPSNYSGSAAAGDFSFLNQLVSAVPGILTVYQQYQAGENLQTINQQRAARGLMPITSQQMSTMNQYANQNPQRFQQYVASGGGGLGMAMPILVVGGLAAVAFFMSRKK